MSDPKDVIQALMSAAEDHIENAHHDCAGGDPDEDERVHLFEHIGPATLRLRGAINDGAAFLESVNVGSWRDAKGALPLNPCPNIWHEQTYAWTKDVEKHPACPICGSDRKTFVAVGSPDSDFDEQRGAK